MTKAKAKPKAEPEEPTTNILLSGKHSRRLPDGTSELFYPGDEIPNPSPAELSAFGDKIVTAEAFANIASSHAQAKQAKVKRREAAKVAKAKASPLKSPDRDPEAVKRGKVLEEIRNDERKKNIRM